ncbi:25.3 kDa vesicle transport protein [Impatiens glandulifera]|uniref:25.3 kDa vesicle transport protein n=1 Tax=Impatiens glandulifera TaxID=253017 RepID=UPI001FB16C34|nr:25.3 kDa vesicle transport protein [Impatiens glandulifera]
MVKLTIVGRVRDALPLAKGTRYLNDEEDDDDLFSQRKQQAEFILNEISTGSLPSSKMTIRLHSHSFNYIVEDGVCFITLCESSYPTRLAFHFLQDLQKELLGKLDRTLIHKVSKPYTFLKMEGMIGNIRKRYIDTRTQSNLSKLNADRGQEPKVETDYMYAIVERRHRLEALKKKALMTSSRVVTASDSPLLELIALKWMPITLVIFGAVVLVWSNLILSIL